ncbi:hypothetical protein YC2023_076097 [Brassica napus]
MILEQLHDKDERIGALEEQNTTILSENATIRSENATILAELASQKKFNTEIMQKLDRLIETYGIKKCKTGVPKTNSFVIPWGEETITLEDVMVLLGTVQTCDDDDLDVHGSNADENTLIIIRWQQGTRLRKANQLSLIFHSHLMKTILQSLAPPVSEVASEDERS